MSEYYEALLNKLTKGMNIQPKTIANYYKEWFNVNNDDDEMLNMLRDIAKENGILANDNEESASTLFDALINAGYSDEIILEFEIHFTENELCQCLESLKKKLGNNDKIDINEKYDEPIEIEFNGNYYDEDEPIEFDAFGIKITRSKR